MLFIQIIFLIFIPLSLATNIENDNFIKIDNNDDWYYVNWIDTEESQRLLEYQEHSFDDFLEDLKSSIGWKRIFIRLSSRFVRRNLEKKSPYINR